MAAASFVAVPGLAAETSTTHTIDCQAAISGGNRPNRPKMAAMCLNEGKIDRLDLINSVDLINPMEHSINSDHPNHTIITLLHFSNPIPTALVASMVFLWIVNLLVMADIRSWFYRASDTVRTADKVCLTVALIFKLWLWL